MNILPKSVARPCLDEITDPVKLQINGEERDFEAPLSVASLVEHLGIKADRVAVELNRNIVARERWLETILKDGDRLEMVHFVGGGG